MTEKEKPVYLGDSKASVSEQEWLGSKGYHVATSEEVMKLAKLAGERHEEFTEEIRPHMNKQEAEYVRYLRCQSNRSYREIAGIVALAWGAHARWMPITNQIAGMVLCELAAKILNEDVNHYPWQDEN